MKRVLFVEDEPAIADAVDYSLTAAGFDVDILRDGESALHVAPDDYDVILLDVMLPRLSGSEVCRRIRQRSSVPIVMVTALTAEIDRVVGLDSGADDYVVKPFSMQELLSRIRAILRRRELDRRSDAATTRTVGPLRLDLVRQTVELEGRAVDVTPSEFRLLTLLASEPGRTFTRREIVERLWQSSHVGDQRNSDVHVKNLRRKIEHDPAHPRLLVTVRGVGYMLHAPTEPRSQRLASS